MKSTKIHASSLFSAPITTIIDAAQDDQLKGIPFLNDQNMIRKYLPPSPATAKGRIKKTTCRHQKHKTEAEECKMRAIDLPIRSRLPRQRRQIHIQWSRQYFCFTAVADKQTSTLYMDATGALPTVSLDGMQYFFIAYDYNTSYIFAEPIVDVKDATIITAFNKIFTELTKKGHKPTFNVTDNQAATPLKAYLKSEGCRWQFIEPHNHRVNTAERAIQTFKNLFVSGLCTTDIEWLLQLWNQMAQQVIIPLNILQKA